MGGGKQPSDPGAGPMEQQAADWANMMMEQALPLLGQVGGQPSDVPQMIANPDYRPGTRGSDPTATMEGDEARRWRAANPNYDYGGTPAVGERMIANPDYTEGAMTEGSGIMGMFSDYLSGNWDAANQPTFKPQYTQGIDSISQGYKGATDDILGMLPEGGAMDRALADMRLGERMDKAQFTNTLTGSINEDMWQKLYGFATGTPQQSIAGMTNAGQIAANRYNTSAGFQGGMNTAMIGAGGDVLSAGK